MYILYVRVPTAPNPLSPFVRGPPTLHGPSTRLYIRRCALTRSYVIAEFSDTPFLAATLGIMSMFPHAILCVIPIDYRLRIYTTPHVCSTLVSESSLVSPHIVATIPSNKSNRRRTRRPPVRFAEQRPVSCDYCGQAPHVATTCTSRYTDVTLFYELGGRTVRSWLERLRNYAADLDDRANFLAVSRCPKKLRNVFEVQLLDDNYPAYPDRPLHFAVSGELSSSQSSFLSHLLRRVAVGVYSDFSEVEQGLKQGLHTDEAHRLLSPYFEHPTYR